MVKKEFCMIQYDVVIFNGGCLWDNYIILRLQRRKYHVISTVY